MWQWQCSLSLPLLKQVLFFILSAIVFCDFLVFAPRALFDWIFDFVAVYIVRSYISCAFPLVLFSSLFLTYLFPY